jgi:hypothetical protein
VTSETVEAARVKKAETSRHLWPSSRGKYPLLQEDYSQESHLHDQEAGLEESLVQSHLLEWRDDTLGFTIHDKMM